MKKQPSASSLNPPEEANFSAFKKREKQYKYFVDKKTDFSGVIDLNKTPLDPEWKIEEFSITHPVTGKPVKGFRFPKPSGLIILKEYTEIKRQLFMCRKALNEYHRKPHRTNLFIYKKEEDTVEETLQTQAPSDPKHSESCMAPQQEDDPQDQPKPLLEVLKPSLQEPQTPNPNPASETHKPLCSQTTKPEAGPREYNKDHYIVTDANRYFFNSKIRWSNLGRQYNWDKRDYHAKQSPMPTELADLAKEITTLLEMGAYRPEALIVNYYGWRNFMGGHLDDGEPDQKHPIVSFSFGLSCVFLIGGQTKEVDPAAIRLDAGDVMVMSQQSRNCFHGRCRSDCRGAQDY